MPDGNHKTNLQQAAELFFRLKDDADPFASALLRDVPAEIVEQVLLLIEGARAAAPIGAGDIESVGPLSSSFEPSESVDGLNHAEELGDFKIQKSLGQGAMGEVYSAIELSTGREVALKVLRPFQASLPGARERFQREAEAASRVDHPAVCRIYAIGEHDGRLFIAMRRINGVTLAELIHGREGRSRAEKFKDLASPPSREQITRFVAIIKTVAHAVQQVHDAGVIHRDLKPANIMITGAGEPEAGQPVILDFGLAHLQSDRRYGLDRLMSVGTLTYIAPEQLVQSGETPAAIDERADIYALGVILYESCTRRVPFSAATRAESADLVRNTSAVPPQQLNPAVSPRLARIIAKAMAKDANDRYWSAQDLADDLDNFLTHQEADRVEHHPMTHELRTIRNRFLHWAAGILVVMAVALGFFVVRDRSSREEQASALKAKSDAQAARERSALTGSATASSSWIRVLEARQRGAEPDAQDAAEVRAIMGEELWAQMQQLTLAGQDSQLLERLQSTLRSSGSDDPLISPRNVITESTPTFRFLGIGDDPSAHDYRVAIVRLDDLEEVASFVVAGNSASANGELVGALPEGASLPVGDAEPTQYMWSVERVSGSGKKMDGSDDLTAIFAVASPGAAATILESVKPSGQAGFDAVRRALILEQHNMIELAMAEIEKIPASASSAELALKQRLSSRLRAAAHLPPLAEDSAESPESLQLSFSAESDESPDAKARLKQLKETSQKELDTATQLFSAQTESDGSDEYKKELRLESRKHLDLALIALDRVSEEFPNEEWTEDLLEDAYSLSFWIDRFTTIDDFDYEAEVAKNREATPDALPAASARSESYEVAMANAKKAEKEGDTAAAFYEYLEVVQYHADENKEGVMQAHDRLMAIRGQLTKQGLLSYLKKELNSKEGARRIFAAQEMSALRGSMTVQPLVSALKDEEEASVREAILVALHQTQKRASGQHLASLAKSKDESLKLAVLETLQNGVGGRHGALAALEFADDKSNAISDRALEVMKGIGGREGAIALGKVAAERGTSSEQVAQIFGLLVQLASATAAEALIPHCTSDGKHRAEAEDALVAIGAPAIIPCINAMSNRSVAKQVHDVLKRMSGQTFGQNQDKWRTWYQQYTAIGGALPRYSRGAEPWMGGSSR